ncbi:type II/IV secretion system ATPase subunit [Halorubrum ruber]|uniref:Flp pilus assembly complex ATPase component TadA n=1 Tax=Halorubrum ruber TaxID=2982524 RepID=A0A8T8LRF0_9EURY|nr:ATPase, T2SS/T4P/T4SS family [Halorubrum ruber]QUO49261.1 Flp pilus assembly complex ATPase component TadA [Halorubrum ruber]
MTDGATLRIVDEPDDDPGGAVPAPVPPGDPEAWYAPDVRAQYEAAPGVVATVRERDGGRFGYDVREPPLSPADEDALDRVRDRFSAVRHRRPLTRVGVVERAERGFEPKYATAIDRLVDATAAARRRIDYHALREFRLLGELTPVALDDRIEVADVGDDRELVVHTETFAPLETGIDADADYVERVAAERLAQYAVEFAGIAVEVVVYRERLLGSDAFETKYAVLEPDLLPGDEELIEECKSRIWETTVSDVIEDRESFVAARARRFLSRRLTARNTRAWLDAALHRARAALADRGLAAPPVDSRFARDRLDDLAYYVLRDFVGEGILTIPIRDPHLEDVEANRVGERVKVVPRASVLSGAAGETSEAGNGGAPAGNGGAPAGDGDAPEAGERVPTNLAFEEETTFVDVVTGIAARDGTELNASTPSAKVNLELDGVPQTIRCAVALPVISEGGPHVSIRKQRADALTPVDLIERGTLSVELVTLLWLLYEHRGVVLFAGPTGVGKTTLLNAHAPFIPFDARPVSVDEGSREVRLPHETGVSLTTRDHEDAYKSVGMAELMTEANYLNPDVEVIAEINTPESFETFAESLSTGHGVIGTTHAEDVEALANRLRERDLPARLLREVDLVVFPRQVDGERYVSRAIEPLSEAAYDGLDPEAKRSPTGDPKRGGAGVVEAGGESVRFNTVAWRDGDGAFRFPGAPGGDADEGVSRAGAAGSGSASGDGRAGPRFRVFDRIANRTDRDREAVAAEFESKRRYVEYLVRDGVDDPEALFEFLADLRTDEAATVERAARTMDRDGDGDREDSSERGRP